MANVINGQNGIIQTADSTSELNIQTGGTTAIAINSSQDVTMANGDLNVSGGSVSDTAGNVRKIPQSGSAKTTSYTLATTDIGEFVEVGTSGSITIPNSTFAAGDVVSVVNNTTGNITITCSITTAYIAGTDVDKATVTLATRGVATILFLSGTVCIIAGNVS